jgi:hypothetical protein
MKTIVQFSIISFFDPYGDMKSDRKQFSRENYQSEKPLEEVIKIIETYNDGKYYNAVEVASFDNRKKEIFDFDKSYYLTSKASSSSYQSIPGH